MTLFNVKAKVITPVSIGDGGALSPYKDYIIEHDKVHYIDQAKLVDLIKKYPEVLDEFVEGVANMDGNKSSFELKDFIKNKLNAEVATLVKACADFEGVQESKLLMRTVIKTPNGLPYIPGSSIKGGIKTALLYQILEKEEIWTKWKYEFFKNIYLVISKKVWKRKELNKFFKTTTNELESRLKQLSEYKPEDKKLIHRLSVSDSSPFECSAVKVMDLVRSKLPIRQEVIKEGMELSFELNTTNLEWKQFCDIINKFSYDNLCTLKNNERVEQLKQEIKTCTDLEAYLAIGFGKGVYLNSILLSLKNFAQRTNQEKFYERYIKILFPKTKNPGINAFPNTYLKTKDHQPLGWIKLIKTN